MLGLTLFDWYWPTCGEHGIWKYKTSSRDLSQEVIERVMAGHSDQVGALAHPEYVWRDFNFPATIEEDEDIEIWKAMPLTIETYNRYHKPLGRYNYSQPIEPESHYDYEVRRNGEYLLTVQVSPFEKYERFDEEMPVLLGDHPKWQYDAYMRACKIMPYFEQIPLDEIEIVLKGVYIGKEVYL